MKPALILYLIFGILLIFGCNPQPLGETLLSSSKNNSSTDDDTTSVDDGVADIQPDNSTMVVNIDDSDRVEITGSCKDLDIKNNRIIVEVFPGEDEDALNPYISNSFSDMCLTTDTGLLTAEKCFWVTKGIGVIEDPGFATERSFPQCHNGRFGFAVKLGKILLPTVGSVNLKYTVRFKLRMLDGLLTDTAFSRVSIVRNLATPIINSTTFSNVGLNFQCNIKTSPARFNFGIFYTLTRTFTDAAVTPSVAIPIYSGVSTSLISDGSSVFSFNDTSTFNIMLRGVTYNYTLSSEENNFAYAPLARPTAQSAPLSCATEQLLIFPNGTPTIGTCPFALQSVANALQGTAVSIEWGFSTNPTWVGANFDNQNPGAGYTPASGADCLAVQTTCTQTGLASGTNFFFAAREVGSDGQKGKWSNVFQCKPP